MDKNNNDEYNKILGSNENISKYITHCKEIFEDPIKYEHV